MRTRNQIELSAFKYKDREATRDNVQSAILEVLLDIRDLLSTTSTET